jgi:hypothetical protein
MSSSFFLFFLSLPSSPRRYHGSLVIAVACIKNNRSSEFRPPVPCLLLQELAVPHPRPSPRFSVAVAITITEQPAS